MKRFGTLILCFTLTVSALFAQKNLVNIPKIKKTYSIDEKGDTNSVREYSYDKLGRCIKVIFYDSYFGYTETIEYPNNTTVICSEVFSRDETTRTTKYKLNIKGQAISSIQIEKKDTTEEIYLYNAAGFSYELGMVVINDNVVKYKSGYNYTFYNNKPNTIGNKNIGLLFLGKDNKNLIKEKNSPVMDSYVKNTYTYELDSKGRVKKQTEMPYNFVTYYEYY